MSQLPTQSIRETARAVIVQYDELLLLRRTRQNSEGGIDDWLSIPGGGLEPEETPQQAVVRELQEELGLEIKIDSLLAVQDVPVDEARHYYFLCSILSGEPRIIEDSEEYKRMQGKVLNTYAVEWTSLNSLALLGELYWAYAEAYTQFQPFIDLDLDPGEPLALLTTDDHKGGDMEYELEEEIKVLNIDCNKLIKRLAEMGAVKKYSTTMTIISYDFFTRPRFVSTPSRIKDVLDVAYKFYANKGSLRDNNAHLRLRSFTHTGKIEFTFKYDIEAVPNAALKQAREYNTYLSESEAKYLKEYSQELGLVQNALHEKRRDSYTLPNECVCDIDTYPGIPTYIELEGTQSVVMEGIDMLELSKDKTSQASGADFFASYQQNFYSTLIF